MGFFDRISDEHAERLLGSAGLVGEGEEGLEETAAFVRALSAAVPAQPDAATAAAMIRTLAETARSASLEASDEATAPMPTVARGGAWRPRLALLGRVAVAVALLPALLAAMAFAGVQLPEPAREAFERVGIELPNQAEVDDAVPAGDGQADGDDDASDEKSGGGADSGQPGGPENAAQGGGPKGKGHDKGKSHGKGKGHGKDKGKGHGKDKGKGHGKDKGHGQSQGGGPSATPPGQGGVPPGNEGVPPAEPPSSPPPSTPPSAAPLGGVPPGQAKK